MALNFLKDRDENEVRGNLGAFAQGSGCSNFIQNALEIYRKDQKSHHEQSIASDLTRGLLRKIFRETVLESSKQVKRKYSYSAVGSSIAGEVEAENIGIMSKLKKLQKERLIVARLGFPDRAMEIDEHIEKIRADLRKERETEDARILVEELAALAVGHQQKLEDLEKELKKDERAMQTVFEQERSALMSKQERQFAQLVDGAIKRAIGKSKSCACSKKYLCHHNKTASFNTRRPTKEVIHFRKNAKRLRHGGRLDESAAWEEKAAELDAAHLDKWREEVAASLSASAWGGSSSALDQLAAQHQREIARMETAQANELTLMFMRHRTSRRNCHNVIMVEQKKSRNTCKKQAEERHRREMLGVQKAMDAAAAPNMRKRSASVDHQERALAEDGTAAIDGGNDVAGMLEDVMSTGATDCAKTPVRPSSAPPARGRRPQPSRQHTSSTSAEGGTGGGGTADAGTAEGNESTFSGSGGGSAGNGDGDRDENSSGGDSRNLRGFDELERSNFSYDDYTVSGSLEEEEWIHVPWCGTNSGDIVIPDESSQPRKSLGTTTAATLLSSSPNAHATTPSVSSSGVLRKDDGVEPEGNTCPTTGAAVTKGIGTLPLAKVDEIELLGRGRERSHGRRGSDDRRGQSPTGRQEGDNSAVDASEPGRYVCKGEMTVALRMPTSEGGLVRYDWDVTKVPTRPTLSATSRIPSGSRAEKIKATNAKKNNPSRKAVTWGQILEVPPEEEIDNESDGDEDVAWEGREGIRGVGDFGLPIEMIDDIVDRYVDKKDESADSACPPENRGHDLPSYAHHTKHSSQQAAAGSGSPAESDADTMASAAAAATIRMGAGLDEGICAKSPLRRSDDARMKAYDGTTLPPERRRSKGVDGVADGPAPTKRASEAQGSGRDVTAQPLQHALDMFCSIRLLHGDWMSLLRQIVAQEPCRDFLRRWSESRLWAADVDVCLQQANFSRSTDGSVRVSWGTATVGAAAASVAAAEILAPFVASLPGQDMVRSEAGRAALGGTTVLEEPAIARSRRPWRTLFERSLGSLPHGAVLSAAEVRDETCDGRPCVAAAGKVLWANEGFERLTGVDATDVVAQHLASLFDVGLAEGTELTRSFEFGQSCTLWMAMTGQHSDPTEVLCVHQPVAVPRALSDEGHYSALLFFDPASVVLTREESHTSSTKVGGREGGGEGNLHRKNQTECREIARERSEGDKDGARRQSCDALASAMVHLLSGGQETGDGEEDDGEQQDEHRKFRDRRRRISSSDDARRSLRAKIDEHRELPSSPPFGNSSDIGEETTRFLNSEDADADAGPRWRDSANDEKAVRRVGFPTGGEVEAHHFGRSERQYASSADRSRDHDIRLTDHTPGAGRAHFGLAFLGDDSGDDGRTGYSHDSDKLGGGGDSSTLVPRATELVDPRAGSTEYSSGNDSPEPGDDLLPSPRGTGDISEAMEAEETQEERPGDRRGCEADEVDRLSSGGGSEGSPADVGDPVDGDRGEADAPIENEAGNGGVDDQYEDDFFSEESPGNNASNDVGNDGCNITVSTANNVALQTATAFSDHPNEGDRARQATSELADSMIPFVNPSRGTYKHDEEKPPVWREAGHDEAVALPGVFVSFAATAVDDRSLVDERGGGSRGGGDGVGDGNSVCSGTGKAGNYWPDGVGSSTAGGPNEVCGGVVEDNEPLTASGGEEGTVVRTITTSRIGAGMTRGFGGVYGFSRLQSSSISLTHDFSSEDVRFP